MSDWPKFMSDHQYPRGVKVIPADLGRELYGLLKAVRQDPRTPEGYRRNQYLDSVLARYEEEVGA